MDRFDWKNHSELELKNLRKYNTKHFRQSDKENICIVSSDAFHYWDKEFKDIPDLRFPEGKIFDQWEEKHKVLNLPEWAGIEVSADKKTVECFDKKGTRIYRFKEPSVCPQSVNPFKENEFQIAIFDKSLVTGVQFEVIGKELFVIVPETSNTLYPIKCYDDTDTTATNNKDSFLKQSVPTEKNGASAILYIANQVSRFRTVMDWTLPSGTGTISLIKLYLYKASSGTNAPAYDKNLHELTQAFVEADVTWNKYDATNDWAVAGGDYDGTIVDAILSTATVDEWHNWILYGAGSENPMSITWESNFDILIKGADENRGAGNYEDFSSKENGTVEDRPYIEITYTPDVSDQTMLLRGIGK